MSDLTLQVPPAVGTSGQVLVAVNPNAGTSLIQQVISIGDPTSTGKILTIDTSGAAHVITASSGVVQTLTSGPYIVTGTVSLSSGTITLSSNPTVVSASSGIIQLSSAPLVIVATSGGQLTITASGVVSLSSGTVTLSSSPLVLVATSGGQITVTASGVVSLSSGTVTLSSNPTVISASSGLVQISGTVTVLSASSGLVQISGTPTITLVGTSAGVVPATTSGGLGVTILGGAASGSTAVNIFGSSGSITPATSSGGLLVAQSNSVRSLSSGTVTLSSNPTVVSASSGLIQLTSAPLVLVATSGGQITVTASGVVSLSSGTVTLSSNPTVISASSGVVQVLTSGPITMGPSTALRYTPFQFGVSSSASLTNVTTAGAILYGWNVGNIETAPATIHLYAATSGVAGSTANRILSIPIPASTGGAGNNFMLPQGVYFTSAAVGGLTFLIVDSFNSTSTALTHSVGGIIGTLYYV